MASIFFNRYGTNPGGPICTILWNKVRSIGMEPGPFHTLPWVWYRGPFHRYGTVHVPGMARVRKTRGLILHDRTIPVPYPFHTSESDFQRIPHPRVWYRGPFHRYGTRVRSIVWNRRRSIPFTRYGTRARSIVWNKTVSRGPPRA